MLLTFSKERYMERILSGVKIHTIRRDTERRWVPGVQIDMMLANPDIEGVVFAHAIVSEVKGINISKQDGLVGIATKDAGEIINFETIPKELCGPLAIADGFDTVDEFFDHFGEFEGRLIFWKNLRRISK
jgi:hypothetical protein